MATVNSVTRADGPKGTPGTGNYNPGQGAKNPSLGQIRRGVSSMDTIAPGGTVQSFNQGGSGGQQIQSQEKSTLGDAVSAEQQRLKEKYGYTASDQERQRENIANNLIQYGSPISPSNRVRTQPQQYPSYTGPRPGPGDPEGISAGMSATPGYAERNAADTVHYPSAWGGGEYGIKQQEAANRGLTGYMKTPYGGGMGGENIPGTESIFQAGGETLFDRVAIRRASESGIRRYDFAGFREVSGKVPYEKLAGIPEGATVKLTYAPAPQAPPTSREEQAKQWREQGVYEQQDYATWQRNFKQSTEASIFPSMSLGQFRYQTVPVGGRDVNILDMRSPEAAGQSRLYSPGTMFAPPVRKTPKVDVLGVQKAGMVPGVDEFSRGVRGVGRPIANDALRGVLRITGGEPKYSGYTASLGISEAEFNKMTVPMQMLAVEKGEWLLRNREEAARAAGDVYVGAAVGTAVAGPVGGLAGGVIGGVTYLEAKYYGGLTEQVTKPVLQEKLGQAGGEFVAGGLGRLSRFGVEVLNPTGEGEIINAGVQTAKAVPQVVKGFSEVQAGRGGAAAIKVGPVDVGYVNVPGGSKGFVVTKGENVVYGKNIVKSLNNLPKKGYVVETSTAAAGRSQTAVTIAAAEKTPSFLPSELTRFRAGLEVGRQLEYQPSVARNMVDLNVAKNLNVLPQTAKTNVVNYIDGLLSGEEAVVRLKGSAAMVSQLSPDVKANWLKARDVRDLDLETIVPTSSNLKPETIRAGIIDAARKGGADITESGIGLEYRGTKIADVLGPNEVRVGGDVTAAGKYRWGLDVEQDYLMIGGKRTQPLSEQLVRKMSTSITIQQDAGRTYVNPSEGRVFKDIFDFQEAAAPQLIKSAKASPLTFGRGVKAQKALDVFKSTRVNIESPDVPEADVGVVGQTFSTSFKASSNLPVGVGETRVGVLSNKMVRYTGADEYYYAGRYRGAKRYNAGAYAYPVGKMLKDYLDYYPGTSRGGYSSSYVTPKYKAPRPTDYAGYTPTSYTPKTPEYTITYNPGAEYTPGYTPTPAPYRPYYPIEPYRPYKPGTPADVFKLPTGIPAGEGSSRRGFGGFSKKWWKKFNPFLSGGEALKINLGGF